LRSQELERAITIAGERQVPAAKRWEVLNAKRPGALFIGTKPRGRRARSEAAMDQSG